MIFGLKMRGKGILKTVLLSFDAESLTGAIVRDVRAPGVNFAEGDYANAASGARVVGRHGGGATVGFLLVITTFVASAGSYVF